MVRTGYLEFGARTAASPHDECRGEQTSRRTLERADEDVDEHRQEHGGDERENETSRRAAVDA